jgi:predicted transposase/invertase (TIGR01784 family)
MKLIKPGDIILNPCLDCVFKALFVNSKNDFRELKALLSRMLDKNVEEVSIINNEPPVENKADRQIRYDVSCKFNDGELADVEIATYLDANERYRMAYYVLRLFSLQDIKGDTSYANLKKTYQISILKQRLFDDERSIHSFRFYDADAKLDFDGPLQITVAELSKIAKLLSKNVSEINPRDKLLMFLEIANDPEYRDLTNELIENDEVINVIAKTLLTVSADEKRRAQAISEEKRRFDLISYKNGWIDVGMQKGRQEGRQEEKFATAVAMIKKNLPIDIISFCTGLSNEEIKKLMEENK